jgi:hypothetical protein
MQLFHFLIWFAWGYDKADKASRAYGLATLKYWEPLSSFLYFIYHKETHILLLQLN